MTERELRAVAEAVSNHLLAKSIYIDTISQAAISASDSKYVKGLVEALKFYADSKNWEWNTKPTDSQFILDCGSNVDRDFGEIARLALQNLPEDLR